MMSSELAETCKEIGTTDLEDAIKIFLLYILALGEITHYRESRVIIRLYRSWECEAAMKHNVKEPASYFEKGAVAVFLENLSGEKCLYMKLNA